jgi:hypothetical protein
MPSLFLHLQLLIVGTVLLPLHHVLRKFETMQHTAGSPETLRKVVSAMSR